MIQTKSYGAPPYDRTEILRYAGARTESQELAALLEECLAEAEGRLTYQVCFRELPVSEMDEQIDLGFAQSTSETLKKRLSGCAKCVVFAATVGIAMDRLISRYAVLSPTKALLFQAIGAERIEALCDAFEKEITEKKREEGLFTRPRFSAGYGDLPLTMQKDIFAVLDCPRRIGLTLNESLLMSPSKSVTAIIGISTQECDAERSEACRECTQEACIHRRKA